MKHREWNFKEEKSTAWIWIESILGAAVLLILFMAVIVLSVAFFPQQIQFKGDQYVYQNK